MDYSPPGSFLCGILQARILEWVAALLSPGDLPNPGIKLTSLMSPALASGFFTTSATWKAHRLLGTNPITKQKYIIEKLGLEVSLFIFLPLDRKILYYFERKGKQYCPVHVFPFEMHSSSPIF